MSNIKTTEKEWDRAKEYFESGLTLSQIVEKTKISKSSLSKKSHADEWSKETQKPALIQKAIDVLMAKETLNETQVSVHDELVDERVTHTKLFNNVAIQNMKEAMSIPCENQNDFKARADTILKSKEVVLGKQIDTAIQINNSQPITITHNEFAQTARLLLQEV